MKTLIISNNKQGQARAYLAKHTLENIAAQHGFILTTDVNMAELVIIIGESVTNNLNLHGKKVFIGPAEQAIREPVTFLHDAKTEASIYQQQYAANATESITPQKPINIVAITACLTGVAHTFMAALPSCILGGAVTGALSMYFGTQLMAPHGGLFVLLIPGAITPVSPYLGTILAGTVLTAGVYGVVKRKDVGGVG
nr:hypothetical protein [Xenorhabdus sp. Flor]